MNAYVALLRAVNVGGTGMLAMSDLKALCEKAGGVAARTYIASGNLVFKSKLGKPQIQAALEKELLAFTGKPVAVIFRTAAEMLKVSAGNPFPSAPGKFVHVIFFNRDLPPDTSKTVTGRTAHEEYRIGKREIYILYGEGMGKSKLRIPIAKEGTARNMNTVSKLAEMATDF